MKAVQQNMCPVMPRFHEWANNDTAFGMQESNSVIDVCNFGAKVYIGPTHSWDKTAWHPLTRQWAGD